MFKGSGKLIYDPYRPGLKKKTELWSIIDVDKELTRYFRYWANKNPVYFKMKFLDLKQPSWNAHISLTRGEQLKPEVQHLWKKYHGERLDFEYDIDIRRGGDRGPSGASSNYFFVDVYCPRADEIRNELKLPYFPRYHLTIGRLWDHDS